VGRLDKSSCYLFGDDRGSDHQLVSHGEAADCSRTFPESEGHKSFTLRRTFGEPPGIDKTTQAISEQQGPIIREPFGAKKGWRAASDSPVFAR
jgi:hypothetical protein